MSTKKSFEEHSLADRLWPNKEKENPITKNPYWDDLPLPYRLWPDTTWPPESTTLSGPAAQYEHDRLFATFYEQEKDNWD